MGFFNEKNTKDFVDIFGQSTRDQRFRFGKLPQGPHQSPEEGKTVSIKN